MEVKVGTKRKPEGEAVRPGAPTGAKEKKYAPVSGLDEITRTGFQRSHSQARDTICEGGDFPPEAGRYVLYVSYACPWACNCMAMLKLKGLEEVIDVCVTHPIWQKTAPDDPEDKHTGWVFMSPDSKERWPLLAGNGDTFGYIKGTNADTYNGARSVREIYKLHFETTGFANKKCTVPVLWDTKSKRVVNNESMDIMRMFNSAFQKFAKVPELDMYPSETEKLALELNEWIYHDINNGVYKCGLAPNQEAYGVAFKSLFAGLDRAEAILSKSRFLTGPKMTWIDLRLFFTLVRFDEVYTVLFKCNKKLVREYDALLNFTRELYQNPGIRYAINMEHIKKHYYLSLKIINPSGVYPFGPQGVDGQGRNDNCDIFLQPHNRDRL